MRLDKQVFYKKSNTLRINAFKTRIDKSRAHFRNAELKYGNHSTSCTFSPYFSNSSSSATTTTGTNKPLVCSLLEHEAETYGYEPKHLSSRNIFDKYAHLFGLQSSKEQSAKVESSMKEMREDEDGEKVV